MIKYKETINARYENIDHIKNYKSILKENNTIKLLFQSGKIEITYFNDDIVKVFIGEPLEESRNTRAMLPNLEPKDVDFTEDINYITILGTTVDTVINKTNLKISFVTKDGRVLSEDYKPAGRRDKKSLSQRQMTA